MSKPLTCIIIDDEPLAQSLIERYVQRLSYLKLLAKFDNAIDAIESVDELKPEIIFLDINMPEMNGIEFIRTFTKNRPHIVLTTAHPQYALDGFENDVVDYLLKPIPFERFTKAINKIRDKYEKTADGKTSSTEESKSSSSPTTVYPEREVEIGTPEGNFFWVKEDKKSIRINVAEVIYVEGMADYIKIHLQSRMMMIHMTMSKIEQLLLPFKKFLRINRSFIVQTSQIKSIDGNMMELNDGKKLPIGVSYRDAVKDNMKIKF